MDFFTVPTASLRVLYCWFVIHHDRRRILHFNATFNPTAAWVIQQLREAFPFETAPNRGISSSTATLSSAQLWLGSSSRWARSRAVSPIEVPGRILWPNAGSALVPPRALRSRCHLRRAPRCSARSGLHRLLSPGPHASRILGKDTPSRRPVTPPPSPTAKVSRGASCRRTPSPVRVARSRLKARISSRLLLALPTSYPSTKEVPSLASASAAAPHERIAHHLNVRAAEYLRRR